MQYTSILLTGASLLASVSAHGFLTQPKPRLAGEAMRAACGDQVYYNQNSDTYGNIQGELQVANGQADYDAEACNVWLCKGFKLEDNTANVQSYTAGQVVPFKFDLRAPHAGTANVSIVETATNTIIGLPLISYDDFANNAYTTPADQLSFSITIPSTLGAKCAVAGACVIQHWWDSPSVQQSYESCIDFTLGGSGAGAPAVSSSVAAPIASSTTAPTTTAAPAPIVTSAVPTTLQTLTRPASSSSAIAIPATSAAAPVVTSAPTPIEEEAPTPIEEEEDCEEL